MATKRKWRGICGCCVTTSIDSARTYYASYIGQNRRVATPWSDAAREAYEAQCMADNEEAKRVDDKLLVKLTEWAMGNPKHKSRRQLKRDGMYVQFTTDLRVDFTDQEKLAVIRQAMAKMARDLYATAALLCDKGSEPQISVYSDDSFAGHEDISILENTVAEGRAELVSAGGSAADENISDEMLEAAASVKFDKSK